ncbi:TonB-dependent receptor [Fulvimarina endophytica]|uniref:TonB-dependent receptor n=1 Tax=Fulvimarina endophytica TaxID=2293836 RepID=A0A371WXQ5_9HYPH|nr:TonB-dependent receptor [Fulvimarina endophytica]RFC61770.1 TonB-dependent receptor [Fulvimarina endophytica]
MTRRSDTCGLFELRLALFAGASLAVIPLPALAQQAAETIALETVTVDGSFIGGVFRPVEEGYEPQGIGGVAAKADLPARQVPFSVEQASAELIEDRGDLTVYEAFESFAGAHTQSTNSDTGSNVARGFFSRGFDIGSGGTVLYNGHRIYGIGSNYRSTVSLAGVELLKGPAAIYYGASEPGGVINYIFKKPLAEARYEIGTRADTDGSYGAFLDAGGPLSKTSDHWRYRFVAEYNKDDDWRDEVEETPKTLYGSLEWAPSDAFVSRLSYEYLDVDGVPQRYDTIRFPGETLLPVPENFFAGYDNDFVDIRQHTVLWETEWTPSEAFGLDTYVLYQHNDQEHQTTRIGGRGGGAPDRFGALPRTTHVGISEDRSIAAGADLKGRFETGAFSHQWLAGYAYSHLKSDGGVVQVSTGTRTNPLRPLRPDAIDPFGARGGAYAFQDELFALIPTDGRGGAFERDDHNVYVQDIVTMPWQTTKLVGAIGYAYTEQTDGPSVTGAGPITTLEDGFVTPRLAVIQDLTDTISVYGSYAESFSPQLLVNDFETFEVLDDPEIGRQYEVGAKQEIMDGAALLTAAAFRIEKENIARRLFPDDELNTNSVLDGVYQSQGLEFGLTGQITDWWTSYMGYAYLDTEVKETDDPVLLGGSIPYVAEHNLALWNKVRVYGEPVGRFGQIDLGLGVNHYSDARDPNGFERDPYTLVDIGLFAEKKLKNGALLKGAVRVENLFDEDYFDQRSFGSSVTYGDPRKVSFQISTVF